VTIQSSTEEIWYDSRVILMWYWCDTDVILMWYRCDIDGMCSSDHSNYLNEVYSQHEILYPGAERLQRRIGSTSPQRGHLETTIILILTSLYVSLSHICIHLSANTYIIVHLQELMTVSFILRKPSSLLHNNNDTHTMYDCWCPGFHHAYSSTPPTRVPPLPLPRHCTWLLRKLV